MKVTSLNVDGFGVWKGLKLTDFSGKLTVIYGANEAGKTTLMHFTRSVLYGDLAGSTTKYIPTVHGGRPGGTLDVDSPFGGYRIERHWHEDSPGSWSNDLLVTNDREKVCPGQTLEKLLAKVDAATYQNVFAIGLRELQELATLNNSEAGRHLYSLAGGVDRVSLGKVRRELATSCRRLFGGTQSPSKISQILARRKELEEIAAGLTEQTHRWSHSSPEKDELTSRVEQIQRELEGIREEARLHELALSVRDTWCQRNSLDARLAKLANPPDLPFDALSEIEKIKHRIDKDSRRKHHLRQTWQGLRTKAQKARVKRRILQHRDQIHALANQRASHDISRLQRDGLISEIHQIQSRLSQQEPQASNDETASESLPSLSIRDLTKLRSAAQALKTWKKRLSVAKTRVNKEQKTNRRETDRLDDVLAARGETDLITAVDNAGNKVELLRRRIQVDERMQQMTRHRDHLVQESDDWLERQILTNKQMLLVGCIFVLGTTLLLAALFGGISALKLDNTSRWILGFVGLGTIAVALFTKARFLRSAEDYLDNCGKQIGLLESRIDQTGQERNQYDEALPHGGGPFAVQLEAAEQELQRLQQYVPLDAERKTGNMSAKKVKKRVTIAADRFKNSSKIWQSTLESCHLPTSFSPNDVKSLSPDLDDSDEVHQQLQAKERELERRELELTAYEDRLERLLTQIGWEKHEDDSPDPCERLTDELLRQERLAVRQKTLARRGRRLKRQYHNIARELNTLRRRRRLLFALAEASDERQFRKVATEAIQAKQLRQQRQELTQEIAIALGDPTEESDVVKILRATGESDLEKRLEQIWDRQQNHELQLQRLVEQVEHCHTNAKKSREDRRMAGVLLELSCVNKQLQDAVRKWKTTRITSAILNDVCADYESTRQPEVLQWSSEYLEQFTDGKYCRIWTPLDENGLRVDETNGKSLGIGALSTGTREQIFLSLRLALANLYAQKDIYLPLVLDDVLVNFDVERTRAAGRVLSDFGKTGHQVILFTCHEHIMKMFQSLRAEIITLPSHADLATNDESTSVTKPKRKKRVKKRLAKAEITVDDTPDTVAEQEIKLSDEPGPVQNVKVKEIVSTEPTHSPADEIKIPIESPTADDSPTNVEIEKTATDPVPSLAATDIKIADATIWEEEAHWNHEVYDTNSDHFASPNRDELRPSNGTQHIPERVRQVFEYHPAHINVTKQATHPPREVDLASQPRGDVRPQVL